MCYLVAKDKDAHGCYALKTVHGRPLVELKHKLNVYAVPKGIQLVTISRPTAYGEYAPYRYATDPADFERVVLQMCADKTERGN